MLICPITGDVHFDHLLQVVSATEHLVFSLCGGELHCGEMI